MPSAIAPYYPEPDLTPNQARAASPDVQKAEPTWAALNAFQSPQSGESNLFFRGGQAARNFMTHPHWFTPAFDHGALMGAGAGGVAGALAGFVGGKALGVNDEKQRRLTLLAGLLGAGLGGMTGYNRQDGVKAASTYDDPKQVIINAISNCADLNFYQQAHLMSAIPQIPDMAADRLSSMIVNTGGALTGAAIARFLMNTGLLGTGVGAVLGASVASNFYNPPVTNAAGQPAIPMRFY